MIILFFNIVINYTGSSTSYFEVGILPESIRPALNTSQNTLDNNGNLVDIFTMSSLDIEEKYGISLDTIISTYGYKQVKKLNLI